MAWAAAALQRMKGDSFPKTSNELFGSREGADLEAIREGLMQRLHAQNMLKMRDDAQKKLREQRKRDK